MEEPYCPESASMLPSETDDGSPGLRSACPRITKGERSHAALDAASMLTNGQVMDSRSKASFSNYSTFPVIQVVSILQMRLKMMGLISF